VQVAEGKRINEPARTLIILPTYNESATLAEVVRRVRLAAPDADVLIIDDASPDGTGAIADGLASDPQICVHHRPAKLGLGTAYLAGFRTALDRGYDVVIEMDADGSHLPEELPRLRQAAHRGAGLVLGTRWMPGGRISGWPWGRRLLSRAGTIAARLLLGSRLRDITGGFRVFDARWLAALDLSRITTQGYGFQVEVAWTLERIGCPISEQPITFVERRSGRSKMTFGIVIEALGYVVRSALTRRSGR